MILLPYFALTGLLWEQPWQVLLTCLSLPPLVASQVITSALAATGSTRTVFLEQLLGPLLRLIFFALALGLLGQASLALGTSLFAMSILVFLRAWHEAERAAGVRIHFLSFRVNDVEQARRLISLGINVMLSGLMSRLDVLIVGSILGMATAGVYAVLMAATAMITISVGAIGRIAGPEIRLALSDSRRDEIGYELERWTRVGLISALVLATAVQGLLTVAMPYMGYGWSVDRAIAAAIAAAAFVVWGGYGMYGYVLSLGGQQKVERSILLVYAAIFAVTAPVGLLLFGLPGIASASLICAIFLSILRVRAVQRRLTPSGKLRGGSSELHIALVIVASLSPGPLMSLLIQDAAWLRFAILLVAGAVTAFISLIIVLTREDRKLMLDLLNRLRPASA
jgi:O-antigen/teichoic acid export membrane protein